MALNPRDMDGFMPLLSSTDIKTKMTIGNNLLIYLGDSSNTIECQDIGLFIDNVIPWLGNGNAKSKSCLQSLTNMDEKTFTPF
ncbi:hypothetical protein PV327_008931 [Microctonus hyperodae]|uniref:Uncharacterized protein n=1 Tax=Microctonus hyperodae TaxID=165561 RepID=A0AA39FTC0_MICHY|nr:hypothetical protein PV327_008931 [Microctonus hyperodae]